MTHSFLVHTAIDDYFVIRGNLLVSLLVKMETYRHWNGHRFTVRKVAGTEYVCMCVTEYGVCEERNNITWSHTSIDCKETYKAYMKSYGKYDTHIESLAIGLCCDYRYSVEFTIIISHSVVLQLFMEQSENCFSNLQLRKRQWPL
jgi:hypothetical protein